MVFERLRARLELDTSGFRSGINDAQRDMDSLEQRGKSMGRSMQKVGGLMTAGITAPIVAMGFKSVQTASNIEEMQSKMSTVFGDLEGDIVDWSQTHAEEVNRSEYQMQEYATTLQDTFVPMGFAREEAAEMSTALTELGIDLASFNNMAEDDAVRRLQSGIVGNHQALREFGVMITQSRLDEELQKIYGVPASEATEAQKAQARYNLILQDTQDAQGDAARTSDSFANQVRGLKAQIEELKLGIGRELLPVAKVLVGYLTTLATNFSNLSDSQRRVIVVVGALAAALGPVLLIVGTMLTMLPAMAAGFAMVAGAVGGGGLIAAVGGAIASLTSLAGVLALVTNPIGWLIGLSALLAAAWINDWGGIQGKTKAVVENIIAYLGPVISFLRDEFGQTLEVWRAKAADALDWFDARWAEHGDEIMAIVGPLWNAVVRLTRGTFDTLIDLTVALLRILRGDWSGAKDALLNIVERLVVGIRDLFKWLHNVLIGGSIVPDMLGDIRSYFANFDLAEAALSAPRDILDAYIWLAHTLVGPDSYIGGLLRDIAAKIRSFSLYDAGVAMVESFARGILRAKDAAVRATKNVAQRVRDLWPGSDAKYGPLTDVSRIGPTFIRMIADGIEANKGRLSASTMAAAGAANDAARDTLGVSKAAFEAAMGEDQQNLRALRKGALDPHGQLRPDDPTETITNAEFLAQGFENTSVEDILAEAPQPNSLPGARADSSESGGDGGDVNIDIGNVPDDAWMRVEDLKEAVMNDVEEWDKRGARTHDVRNPGA